MLSNSKLSSVDYYLDVTSPDYFFRPGEPPGKWWGKGAELLGLTGKIKPDAFKALWEGFILGDRPDSASGGSAERIALVQNAGEPKRRPGEDCCFAPDKSVSVLWSQFGPTLRKSLEECHEGAASAALEYLSQTAIITRRGKEGLIREHALPVVAMFEHGSNREHEPHLHTHCLIFNVCVRADGSTGAIDERTLYHHKMTGGALYQAELDHLLQRELKARTKRKDFAITIDGVPQKLCDLHSTRAKQVKEQLAKTGFKSARAAEIAAKDTRRPKTKAPPSRSELLGRWRSVNEQFGFDEKAANKLVGKRPRKRRKPDLKKLAAKAVKHYQRTEAMFYEQEIIRYVAKEGLGYGFSVREIIQAVRDFLKENPDVVSLKKRRDQANYSTKHMLAMEAAIREAAARGTKVRSHMVRSATYDRMIAKHFAPDHTLNEDDRERNAGQICALRHITSTPGNMVVVEGVAGSGKTYLLSVAREMWERDGYTVHGMCLAGTAAETLQRDSGIESETVRMWLARLNRVGNYTYHQKRQLKRLIQGKRTYAYRGRRHTLNSKSIVVLDEAAMVGTKDMLELINHVEKAGAKLVLIGERRQLQPIAAGGPMGAIIRPVGKTDLRHVTRQKLEPDDPDPEWHRKAHQDIADGEAAWGLGEFAKRGRLTVHADREATQFALVQDWSLTGIKQPLDNIILTAYCEEAQTISRICQQARWDSGELEDDAYFELGDKRFYVGDVVLLTQISRRYGVNNGDRGVIQGMNQLTGTVKIHFPHKNASRVIPYREYTHIDLGYAMTTHKAQGATKPNVFVMLGGSMQDLHLTYVQTSRAQFSTRLYVDKQNAGHKLENLINDVKRARPKQNASDWMDGPRKDESEFVDPDSVKFTKPTGAGQNQSGENHNKHQEKRDSTKSSSSSKRKRAKKRRSRPKNDQRPPQSAKPNANADSPSLSDATLPPKPPKQAKPSNGKQTKPSVKPNRGNSTGNMSPPAPPLRDATLPPADPTPASEKQSNNAKSGRVKANPSDLNADKKNSQPPRQQETRKAEGKWNERPDRPQSVDKQHPKKPKADQPRTPSKGNASSPPPTPNKTPTGRSEQPGPKQTVKQPAKVRPHVPPLPRGYRPRDARDLSHVNVVKSTDPQVLETAIDRYGKLPGGIVTEGAASCDFRIHSLRIDPHNRTFLIANEKVRYDTGLSPEEVAILWHAVVETKDAQENFGVLSQREPIAVQVDTIVASQMMKADNWLGGLVYGYDSNYKLGTSRLGDYRNPFVEEIKHVTQSAYLRMLGVNQILGLSSQFFLKVSDAEFTQVDDHFIASFATKITMAIGVINGPHIVVTKLPHLSHDRPLIEVQFPWVHAAFNHCARYVREYAHREPSLAKAIAYCELVLLLRKGMAANAKMETPDHLDDALARRQRIDLPRYDYCQLSPPFCDAAKSAAGALLSHKYEETQERILAVCWPLTTQPERPIRRTSAKLAAWRSTCSKISNRTQTTTDGSQLTDFYKKIPFGC